MTDAGVPNALLSKKVFFGQIPKVATQAGALILAYGLKPAVDVPLAQQPRPASEPGAGAF